MIVPFPDEERIWNLERCMGCICPFIHANDSKPNDWGCLKRTFGQPVFSFSASQKLLPLLSNEDEKFLVDRIDSPLRRIFRLNDPKQCIPIYSFLFDE